MSDLRHYSLIAWQRADDLFIAVHRLAMRSFPPSERFELTAQLRKAAYSIPANIAEGFKRMGKADKVRFYNISEGSAEELKDALILLRDRRHPFDFQALWEALEDAQGTDSVDRRMG